MILAIDSLSKKKKKKERKIPKKIASKGHPRTLTPAEFKEKVPDIFFTVGLCR